MEKSISLKQGPKEFYVEGETNFSPTMEQIRVLRKNNRQKLAGSLKNNIPIITVPTAPSPVQTA